MLVKRRFHVHVEIIVKNELVVDFKLRFIYRGTRPYYFFFPMKTIESLGCGLYAGAAYLRVNTVCIIFAPIFFVESRGEC